MPAFPAQISMVGNKVGTSWHQDEGVLQLWSCPLPSPALKGPCQCHGLRVLSGFGRWYVSLEGAEDGYRSVPKDTAAQFLKLVDVTVSAEVILQV